MPEVSVIVPFYKAEKTIEKCARSLFEQTLDDIEFLFVDDCSPDGSLRVLETVLEDYPSRKSQVRILKTDSNSGSALARVLGIEKAAGEYLIHCDGDDEVERTMYKTMSEKARQEDSDFVWCDFFRDGPQSFSSSESASCAAGFDKNKAKELDDMDKPVYSNVAPQQPTRRVARVEPEKIFQSASETLDTSDNDDSDGEFDLPPFLKERNY